MISGDGFGRVRAGLIDASAHPTFKVPGRRPVVYNHSAASDAREMLGRNLTAVRDITQKITEELKLSVVAGDNAGSFGAAGLPAAASIGAATHRGRVSDAVTAHETLFGAPTDGDIGFYCVSMGTTNSLIFALNFPSLIKWMVLFSPVFDLVGYYDADTQGNKSAIAAGWNVNPASDPLPSEADIYARRAELSGIPIHYVASSDDPYSTGAFAAKYANMVALPGASHQALGAVGHGNGTVLNADWAQIKAFIQANGS